jgi:hypothetical protein
MSKSKKFNLVKELVNEEVVSNDEVIEAVKTIEPKTNDNGVMVFEVTAEEIPLLPTDCKFGSRAYVDGVKYLLVNGEWVKR